MCNIKRVIPKFGGRCLLQNGDCVAKKDRINFLERKIKMKTNENGRSMVEMLGVLAIIGVLSVGGIYGYTVAMRKYKANEIVQTASMLATMAQAADAGEGAEITLGASGLDTNPGGVALDGTNTKAGKPEDNGNGVKVSKITIKGVADAKLCAAVTAVAPKTKDSDAATRSGYYIESCGS